MKNIFDLSETNAIIERINKLDAYAKPLWGKMSVDQMLAHCNVTYEMIYDTKHQKPNAFKKFMLKAVVKPFVVSEKPYKKNSRTAPEFVISNAKNFVEEKARLIDFLKKTQSLGSAYFDNKPSHSFGKLTASEWNNLFYKHLDHHLKQFGV
ncbi:DUF1569 domain-containing protein [Sabulilitoribacter multivorans]|uniref:DUF1569 domain-containing protein n=1 Tax=Flaviramulus multivorans TaxID=1304750 RepID=A0ABS9IHS8_9FLAO|nr:DUF1569 domain-containing protein [Flaviramulus multivorans]MCF7559690.1 DUF1569 domain-containing protein [Flaviramulus multivorans]